MDMIDVTGFESIDARALCMAERPIIHDHTASAHPCSLHAPPDVRLPQITMYECTAKRLERPNPRYTRQKHARDTYKLLMCVTVRCAELLAGQVTFMI